MRTSSAGGSAFAVARAARSDPGRSRITPRQRDRLARGFTLMELLVVLIVLSVAVGLVAPAFLPPRRPDPVSLVTLIRGARDLAARRGESLYLRMAASGGWRLESGESSRFEVLSTGDLENFRGPNATLVISPLGSCAFDVRSGAAAQTMTLDPLTCELIPS